MCESVLLSIELKLIQVWRRQCLLLLCPVIDEKLKMHQVGVRSCLRGQEHWLPLQR